MTDADYRQMEELEQERLERTLAILTRVALGVSNYDDARFLAAELGVGNLWPRNQKELADAHNSALRQSAEARQEVVDDKNP